MIDETGERLTLSYDISSRLIRVEDATGERYLTFGYEEYTPGRYRLVSVTDNAVKRHPDVRWPGKFRCTGSFVVDGTFVATQRFRGMVGIKEALYDIGASVLINSELGAEIRYADGRPFEIGELKANVTIKDAWLMFPKDSRFLIKP